MKKVGDFLIDLKFFKVTVRYVNVLFKIDVRDMLSLLGELGYRPAIPSVPKIFKGIVGGRGSLARKHPDIEIEADLDRQAVGVISSQPSLAVEELAKIERKMREEVLSSLKPQYYEVLAEFLITGSANPLRVFYDLSEKIDILANFVKSTGLKASIFGLRITPPKRIPDSPDWFEIEIAPHVNRPENAYYISVIYRKPDLKSIEDFVKNMSSYITTLINTIEKKASIKQK